MTTDQSYIIRALKENDIAALEKLYKMYYSKLFYFARRFDGSSLDPDDFVQQSFIAVWEKRNQLKEDVLIDKQLFVICRNIILNQLKRDKKVGVIRDVNNLPFEMVDEQPEEENLEKLWEIRSIIQRLPKKRKEIFLLHKFENLTYDEIAANSLLSKKTIANHIYLATIFIKRELLKR